jgi:hypothetical protein
MLWTHRWPWQIRSALVLHLRRQPPLGGRCRPGLETLEGRCLPSTIFDVAADFSPTNNPNGVWSYGWSQTLGSTFVLDTVHQIKDGLDEWVPVDGGPGVYHNGTPDPIISNGTVLVQPGEFGMHPGATGEYSVVRWTAPEDGVISLATMFFGQDFVGPTTTDVHILHNGSSFFDGIVNGFGPGSGPSFARSLAVSAGDAVDVAVGYGPDGNYNNDSTGVAATIAYTPSATSSVDHPLLWPPFHQLVNVGLHVDVTPPGADVQVLVYGNDHANPSDAQDIAPETLRLRAERQLLGLGRVYLIVAEATDDLGDTGFDVSTVVVPRFLTDGDIAGVQLQALGAETWYRQYQTAPPGFCLLGEERAGADGHGVPSATVSVAGFGQVLATSQEPPAVLGSTVAVRSGTPLPLAVQPDHPTGAEAIPARLPLLDARHAQDAVFAALDAETDGLTLNWM